MKLTNRLGLMQPTNSDPFTPDDFNRSFGTLDGVPGVKPILNFGGLPTGLNSFNHGTMFLQTDLQILWMWNQPSSSGAGSWYRVGGMGVMAALSQSSDQTTTATDDAHAFQLLGTTLKSPGGTRYIGVEAFCGSVSNTGSSGIAVVSVIYNGSAVVRAYSNADPTSGGFASLNWFFASPAQGTSMKFQLTLQGWQGGTTTHFNGGGCKMTIFEL